MVDTGTELVLAPGLVVVVLVVVVLVVVEEDVVVAAVVVVVVDDVEVVVEDGDNPSITPPTVVPDFGPPKIDDRERPAPTSTAVTTPRARIKAPSAEPVATSDSRQRLSAVAWSIV